MQLSELLWRIYLLFAKQKSSLDTISCSTTPWTFLVRLELYSLQARSPAQRKPNCLWINYVLQTISTTYPHLLYHSKLKPIIWVTYLPLLCKDEPWLPPPFHHYRVIAKITAANLLVLPVTSSSTYFLSILPPNPASTGLAGPVSAAHTHITTTSITPQGFWSTFLLDHQNCSRFSAWLAHLIWLRRSLTRLCLPGTMTNILY